MRWSTYERLRRQLDAAERYVFSGFLARHKVLIAWLGRKPRKARYMSDS